MPPMAAADSFILYPPPIQNFSLKRKFADISKESGAPFVALSKTEGLSLVVSLKSNT